MSMRVAVVLEKLDGHAATNVDNGRLNVLISLVLEPICLVISFDSVWLDSLPVLLLLNALFQPIL